MGSILGISNREASLIQHQHLAFDSDDLSFLMGNTVLLLLRSRWMVLKSFSNPWSANFSLKVSAVMVAGSLGIILNMTIFRKTVSFCIFVYQLLVEDYTTTRQLMPLQNKKNESPIISYLNVFLRLFYLLSFTDQNQIILLRPLKQKMKRFQREKVVSPLKKSIEGLI